MGNDTDIFETDSEPEIKRGKIQRMIAEHESEGDDSLSANETKTKTMPENDDAAKDCLDYAELDPELYGLRRSGRPRHSLTVEVWSIISRNPGTCTNQ